jgi:hypothetical protein
VTRRHRASTAGERARGNFRTRDRHERARTPIELLGRPANAVPFCVRRALKTRPLRAIADIFVLRAEDHRLTLRERRTGRREHFLARRVEVSDSILDVVR